MLRKAGIFMIAVMFVAVTAGLSFASDILTYRDAGANYFPTAAQTTFNQGYGNSLIDGTSTGMQNGLPTNVFVNPQGLGDLLIYGYYNVRNGETNVFSVTNTADYGVRARVRFKVAKDSCEVLDFDICLTPHDVWHGIITKDSSGKAIVNAVNIDTDTPIAVGDQRGFEPPVSGLPFPELYPDGVLLKTGNLTSCDRAITADDTLEGYVFVIAENQLSDTLADNGKNLCGIAKENGTDSTWVDVPTLDVGNVLFGSNYIIGASDIYGYSATALGDWANQAFTTSPSSNTPDINNGGDPLVASTIGICPVNFALTKATMQNSFYDLGLGTETIVNFPTKSVTLGSACDVWANDDTTPVGATLYDDQENSITQHCTTSPCESIPTLELPNEVNVVSINGAKIFDSIVEAPLDTTFTLGYMALDLTTDGSNPVATRVTTVNGVSSFGLPAIGYVVTNVSDSGLNWMLPVVYTQQVSAIE